MNEICPLTSAGIRKVEKQCVGETVALFAAFYDKRISWSCRAAEAVEHEAEALSGYRTLIPRRLLAWCLAQGRGGVPMTLGGVNPGDIVPADRKGRRFYAVVLASRDRELEVEPTDRRVTYRSS